LLLLPTAVSAQTVLLNAPNANGSFYGMYCVSCIGAQFTLNANYYVSTIDVVVRTPSNTSYTNFNFSLLSSVSPVTTVVSQTLSAPQGAVSTLVFTVNQLLPAGTYYLVGNVPNYFGSQVTAGDVDGWMISTGTYSGTAGTITDGVGGFQGSNWVVNSSSGYHAPAFTVNGSTQAQGWSDNFDSYALGSFPSANWQPSGNNGTSIVNSTYVSSPQSVQMYGTVGACWAAIIHRQIKVTPPYTIQFSVRNGTEPLSGCHPLRGWVGLNTGPSWTTSNRTLGDFNANGNFLIPPATTGPAFPLLSWIKVRVTYELPDSTHVRIGYWLNDQFYQSVTTTQNSYEGQLAWLSISSSEGTSWFDDVSVTPGLPNSLSVSTTGSGTVTSADGNINCGTACSYNYAPGSVVTLTATPTVGWTFTGWNGCDAAHVETCTVTINGLRGVSASFAHSASTYILSVATIGTGSGIITSSDGQINCPSYCSGSYNSGSSVTLTATAGWDSTFVGWTGCTSSSGNTCTLTMNSDMNATAAFGGSYSGLNFVPVAPCRVADTRNGIGTFGGPSITGGTSRYFPIPQSGCNIPSTALAYSLNITAVPHGFLGYLTVWPTGLTRPVVSTLNSYDGRVKANAAIVPAGTGGAISAFVTDTTDMVIDIDGYFVSDPTQLAFYPLAPCRVFDTRNATGSLGGPSMAAGQQRSFPVLQSSCSIPSTAQAYSLNFTIVPRGFFGYLTVWPTGLPRPIVSTLNSYVGQVTANAAIVPTGSGGQISAFVTDNTDLLADINGYFAPPGAGGLSLYPAAPCRVADTRTHSEAFQGQAEFNMVGYPCAIPADAQAVVLNATVVPPGFLGYLTLWPDGLGRPVVSTLNSYDGAITSNMAIVPILDGIIDAFTTDTTDLILDISSYFAP
jgi:hypothetical protein